MAVALHELETLPPRGRKQYSSMQAHPGYRQRTPEYLGWLKEWDQKREWQRETNDQFR